MATVKLATARSRGADDYAEGDLYECSDAEAQTLIAMGAATKVAAKPEVPKVEAAVIATPENAAAPKPTARKARETKE